MFGLVLQHRQVGAADKAGGAGTVLPWREARFQMASSVCRCTSGRSGWAIRPCSISRMYPEGPAQQAGLKQGDELITVDGVG